jgi:hypothetical protein
MLTDYKNDLFATHDTMPSALRYVNTLCAAAASSADSIAIRTAAHIILNTAIEMHRAEKQVLVDKINEMSARKDPVTALLSLVREQVVAEVKAQTHTISAELHDQIDSQIENWASDNLGDQIADWMADNLEHHVEQCLDIDEVVSEQISNYFGNNTFSIEPR